MVFARFICQVLYKHSSCFAPRASTKWPALFALTHTHTHNTDENLWARITVLFVGVILLCCQFYGIGQAFSQFLVRIFGHARKTLKDVLNKHTHTHTLWL